MHFHFEVMEVLYEKSGKLAPHHVQRRSTQLLARRLTGIFSLRQEKRKVGYAVNFPG